ncbi:DUF1501 domain-containing protein [Nocardioides mangrovi]|uniref:DUF1501 domain-containing protein n=1 Tax=Nocardioides mangrovi TaxID=2874580 RepID=A0ABS7UCY3_9ACTN|nr:DUF1501 domain-containing protein [Nocardioides mangrovi]MBZ5738507.1 DUF1501 domain-containing protein [Nocardioides mangrovi]
MGATTMFGSAVVTMDGLTNPALAATTSRTKPATSVIVLISLRGAADGLSLVVPHAEAAYYAGRPGIAVPATSLLAADATFGLHPGLAPLLPLWTAGKLAAVHATGLPVANRSHFSAMEEIEDADPGSSARVGWLNRMIGAVGSSSNLKGLAVGSGMPSSFLGPEPVMSFRTLETANVAGDDASHERIRALRAVWTGSKSPVADAFRTALDSVVDLTPATEQPNHAAAYPTSDLGKALSAVARTLRADLGVSAVTVDSGNWDMHVGLGKPDAGWMLRNATDLASSIAAFFDDLGPVADKVTLVTLSEFGRRVQQNGTSGLDHGWGNVMFLAGAGVKGGKYYGTWPGLQNTLDADVQVTTDYRSVLAEVVAARTTASTATVFPGFSPETVGVMTSL